MSSAQTERPDRRLLIATLGLAMVGIALRAYAIGRGSFWVDEAYSARMAQLGAIEIIKTTAGDVHPPLYYLLLRYWMLVFGTSEAALRSMSLVLDALATLAIADFAWLLFRRRAVALTAVALHVVSPFAILYAQEARMYSLMLLLSTLSAAWLVRALRTGTMSACVIYVLSSILVVYTHMFGFFMLAGQAAFVMAGILAPKLRVCGPGPFGALSKSKAIAVALAIPALTAPWALVVRQQMNWAAGEAHKGVWWIPKPPLKGLVGPFYSFGGDSLVFMAIAVALLAITASAMIALVLEKKWPWLDLSALGQGPAGTVLLLLVMLLSPILMSFVVSYVSTPVYVSRFMMGGYSSFLVLLALAVALAPRRSLQLGGAAVLLALSAWRIPAVNYDRSFKANSPWRELTEALRMGPQQPVVYQPVDEWPVDWYVRRQTNLQLTAASRNLDDKVEGLATAGQVTLIGRKGKVPAELIGATRLQRGEVVEFGDLAIASYRPMQVETESPSALAPAKAE